MGLPFGVKQVGDNFGENEVLSIYGNNFIFDPDVYVEGLAYTRFLGEEPDDFDVLLLRYTPTKLNLLGISEHVITQMEFHLAEVMTCEVYGYKVSLLPAILRILKGEV